MITINLERSIINIDGVEYMRVDFNDKKSVPFWVSDGDITMPSNDRCLDKMLVNERLRRVRLNKLNRILKYGS